MNTETKTIRILTADDHALLRQGIAALVDQFYSEVQKMGGGRWDTSSLIRLLRDKE